MPLVFLKSPFSFLHEHNLIKKYEYLRDDEKEEAEYNFDLAPFIAVHSDGFGDLDYLSS